MEFFTDQGGGGEDPPKQFRPLQTVLNGLQKKEKSITNSPDYDTVIFKMLHIV